MSHGCQEMYIKCREGIFPHLQNAARKIHKEWLKDEKKNSLLNIFWTLEYYRSIKFFFEMFLMITIPGPGPDDGQYPLCIHCIGMRCHGRTCPSSPGAGADIGQHKRAVS